MRKKNLLLDKKFSKLIYYINQCLKLFISGLLAIQKVITEFCPKHIRKFTIPNKYTILNYKTMINKY